MQIKQKLRIKKELALIAICSMLATLTGAVEASPVDSHQNTNRIIVMPTKAKALKRMNAALPITYHGGSVLSNYPLIYLIFYGNFNGSTTPQILTDLASNQTKLSYWTTLYQYYSVTANHNYYMRDTPRFGKVVYDTSYSQGTKLTDSSIIQIIKKAMQAKNLPLSANAMYFVITSADVNMTSGMCTNYCGWHTSTALGNSIVRYAYIGSPLICPNACSYNQNPTPNNNREADGMANIIMHEMGEMMTDPDITSWFDANYYENADKCAWTWGTKYTAANGAQANVHIGQRDFLIQQTWINAAQGYCGLSA